MTKLNYNENQVFEAICISIICETGGQFGWADNIQANLPDGKDTLTAPQVAGYCSQLEKKGLYSPMKENGYTMIMLTEAGAAYAATLGDKTEYETV